MENRMGTCPHVKSDLVCRVEEHLQELPSGGMVWGGSALGGGRGLPWWGERSDGQRLPSVRGPAFLYEDMPVFFTLLISWETWEDVWVTYSSRLCCLKGNVSHNLQRTRDFRKCPNISLIIYISIYLVDLFLTYVLDCSLCTNKGLNLFYN